MRMWIVLWMGLAVCVLAGCSDSVVTSMEPLDGDADSDQTDASDGDHDGMDEPLLDGDEVVDGDADGDGVDDPDGDGELDAEQDFDPADGDTDSDADETDDQPVCEPNASWCEETVLHVCNEDGTDEYIPTDCGPIGCEDGACVEENALDLREYGSYAMLSDKRLTYGKTEASIEMWFVSESLHPSTILYAEGGVIAIRLWQDGHISYQEKRSDIGWTYVDTAPNPFTLTEWHHLAVVRAGDRLSIFLDGIKILEGNGPPSDSGLVSGSENTVAGGFLSTEHYCFAVVDELRISNSVRYAEDFEPAYRHEPDEQTIGLWHFDEGEGSVVHDASPNGHDGSLHGDATWTTDAVWRNWHCIPQWGQCLPDSTDRKICREDGLGWGEPTDCGPIGCEDRHCIEEHALSFNNSDDGIQVADRFLIRRETEATIEMWVWLEERETTADFEGHNLYMEGDPSRLVLAVNNNGRIHFSEHDPDAGWNNFPTVEGVFPFETWAHLAVTKNAAQRILFVNGEQVAASPADTVPFDYVPEEASILGRKMYGQIDELRLSDTVRYTEDFTPVFRHQGERFDTPQDEHTIGLWHFDANGWDVSANRYDLDEDACTFTDEAVWRNWTCVPEWTTCATEQAVQRCNANGRWMEEELCTGGTCETINSSKAVCQ